MSIKVKDIIGLMADNYLPIRIRCLKGTKTVAFRIIPPHQIPDLDERIHNATVTLFAVYYDHVSILADGTELKGIPTYDFSIY